MQYRNAAHATTCKSPVVLFKNRNLRTAINSLQTGEVTFFKGNEYIPSNGIILGRNGKKMITIMDIDDFSKHRRHVDQVRFKVQSEKDSDSDSIMNDTNSDSKVSESVEDSQPRRSERLQTKPRIDYANPVRLSASRGCDD